VMERARQMAQDNQGKKHTPSDTGK